MVEITGPQFAVLNQLSGSSTFWIEGEQVAGTIDDLARHTALDREPLAKAIATLANSQILTMLDENRVVGSRKLIRKVHSEVLDSIDKGLIRKLLLLLAQNCERPEKLIAVDGINAVLGINHRDAYALYDSLKRKEMLRVEMLSQPGTLLGASWGVYLMPKAKAMADVWLTEERKGQPPEGHPEINPQISQRQREKTVILFLASNPKDSSKLRLDEEIRAIQERIRAAEFRDSFELVSRWAVRPLDVLQALNEIRPHIVHFSGHGTKNCSLILDDADGTAKAVADSAIAALFKNMKDDIQIILLNACHSEDLAKALSAHIGCSIGMSSTIGDEAAITFASSFYGALAFGRTITQAFEQGRVALMLQGIHEEDTPKLFSCDGASDKILTTKPPAAMASHSPNPTIQLIFKQMSKLFNEMKNDLERPGGEFVREFFVLRSRSVVLGGSSKPRFMYYEDEHKNLRGQIDRLENIGYVIDVTPGNVPIYRMTEDFVQLVLEFDMAA
jgi:hypothetical protein